MFPAKLLLCERYYKVIDPDVGSLERSTNCCSYGPNIHLTELCADTGQEISLKVVWGVGCPSVSLL